jgi:6-phosphogluconolactonase
MTRRSLLLALLMTCGFLPSSWAADVPSEVTVFLGTYTRNSDSKGIYASKLNLKTGELSQPELKAEIANPSFLAIAPDGKHLYCVAELAEFEGKKNTGGVAAFEIDPATKNLKPLNQQSSGGAGPCHCVVDHSGRNVLVANYGGGSVACLPINADGSLKPASAFIQHAGEVADKKRQQGPHGHSINVDHHNRFAVAADLGLDKLLVYRFDAEKGTLEPNEPPSTSLQPVDGPRHFAFHPNGDFAYAINEISLTVTAFRYAPQHGVLYAMQRISTVPDDVKGPKYSTAEVQVHPSGKWVYGSNRGHDSIAMFAVDAKTGQLKSLGQEPSGGKIPRNFGIDPTGQFLLAANQDSGNVVVFRINQETGTLERTGHEVACPKPVCVKFLF